MPGPMSWFNHDMKTAIMAILLAAAELNGHGAVNFYSQDTNHLWNRLYSGMIVRSKDDIVLDDLLDPPFWPATKYLQIGESHTNAISLLREFVGDRKTLEQMAPLQCAMMQRDLIALFHWVEKTPMGRKEFTPEQRKLAENLIRAIRFVALSTEAIHQLPGNYARAVSLPGAITAFDEKQPARAFLPKDLLSDESDWLALEPRKDYRQTAPAHFKSLSGRSVFEVRFRHAEGRKAGEGYLDQLADLPKPWLFEKPDVDMSAIMPYREMENFSRWVNPETPQFPPGSMWALVRRAILVETEGNLVVSPLVESVQVRVYRKIARDENHAQTFFEWELSRRLLFGSGGFHLTQGRDQQFSQFFASFEDRIESSARLNPNPQLGCATCHLAAGIHSVQSRARVFNRVQFENEPDRPPEFRAVTSRRLAEVALELANQRAGWQLFRKMWGEQFARIPSKELP